MKKKSEASHASIKAGDVILSEQPFVYILSSKEKGIRCDNCLERDKVMKCSECHFVHYCGRECQKNAWNDHKWECKNLKRIAPKVLPDAARMLAIIINRLNKGNGNTFKSYYTGSSFRSWKDLMSHYSDLKSDKKRMDHFSTLCVVLFEFLKDTSLPNTVELMGLYGRMVINSFTILDIDMNSIGTGVYLASSILDHSCNPNAVATFIGKTISIRATKDMPSLDWNQIRISYIDLMKTPYERQIELLENYYFLCQCDRCMDETQLSFAHAAKCLNSQCDKPVNIPWKNNYQLVLYANPYEIEKTTENLNRESTLNIERSDNEVTNKTLSGNCEVYGTVQKSFKEYIENGINKSHPTIEENCLNTEHKENRNNNKVVCCTECGSKYSDENIVKFKKIMEFTEIHLQNMKDVDVCKYSLEKQENVLHPLNVMHAQTLDHAFDAFIQIQLWENACQFAEKLIPCFRFYYGELHPLLGILHLKYGKILLYKMNVQKALYHFKECATILKITHGENHPLYSEQLLPLLRQAVIESH